MYPAKSSNTKSSIGRASYRAPGQMLPRSRNSSWGTQNSRNMQKVSVQGARMATIPGRKQTHGAQPFDRTPSKQSMNSASPQHADSPPLASMVGFTMTSRDISKLRCKYETLFHDKTLSREDLKMRVRRLVITEGVPDDSVPGTPDEPRFKRALSLRARIWLLLLDVDTVDPQLYFELVELGPGEKSKLIKGDAPRTFPSDRTFRYLVHKTRLMRLLNAFSHWCRGLSNTVPTETAPIINSGYVQGMNRIAAPLLMVLPEVAAFSALCNLLTKYIPRWFEGGVLGVMDGCNLVDECLHVIDPELRNHLYSQNANYTQQMFAISRILSLYACCEPSNQVLYIWDALFSFGVHLVVLLCTAEAVLKRDEILSTSRNAVSLLNYQNCRLNASTLINGAMEILPSLPPRLYRRVIAFPFVSPDKVAQRSSDERCSDKSTRLHRPFSFSSESPEKHCPRDVKPVSSATRKRLERKAVEQGSPVHGSSRRAPPPPPPPRTSSPETGSPVDPPHYVKPTTLRVAFDDRDKKGHERQSMRTVAENAHDKLRRKLSNSESTSAGYVGKDWRSGSNGVSPASSHQRSASASGFGGQSMFSPILTEQARRNSSKVQQEQRSRKQAQGLR